MGLEFGSKGRFFKHSNSQEFKCGLVLLRGDNVNRYFMANSEKKNMIFDPNTGLVVRDRIVKFRPSVSKSDSVCSCNFAVLNANPIPDVYKCP